MIDLAADRSRAEKALARLNLARSAANCAKNDAPLITRSGANFAKLNLFVPGDL